MKTNGPMHTFRLVGHLVDAAGNKQRREMTISTSESFDKLSERAENLLTRGKEAWEVESFMLIPAPSNDLPTETTAQDTMPSRWVAAMERAAEAIGIPPASPVPPATPIPIPGVYRQPEISTPPTKTLDLSDMLKEIKLPSVVVKRLDCTKEETEACFEFKA